MLSRLLIKLPTTLSSTEHPKTKKRHQLLVSLFSK